MILEMSLILDIKKENVRIFKDNTVRTNVPDNIHEKNAHRFFCTGHFGPRPFREYTHTSHLLNDEGKWE